MKWYLFILISYTSGMRKTEGSLCSQQFPNVENIHDMNSLIEPLEHVQITTNEPDKEIAASRI